MSSSIKSLSCLSFRPYGGWLSAVSETRRTYLGSGVPVNETRNRGSGSRWVLFAWLFRIKSISYPNVHPYGGWLCAVSETRRTYLGSGVPVTEARNIGSGSRGVLFAGVCSIQSLLSEFSPLWWLAVCC